MRRNFLHLIKLTLVLSACGKSPQAASNLDTDAVSRRIIGDAVEFIPAAPLADPKIVTDSLRATRAAAWRTFAEVVSNSERNIPIPDGSAISVQIPKVFTWYAPEDVNRLLQFSLPQLSIEDLDKGLPLTKVQWAKSQTLLRDELDTLPLPLHKKWARFFDTNPKPKTEDIIGATGMNRTLFSPGLIGAVASQYADLQTCYPNDLKPSPFTEAKPCWSPGLPRDSVMIKTVWLNAEAGFRSAATDAESLKKLMMAKDKSWADAFTEKDEIPSNIVTAKSNGKSFVLGGIHIVSKELEDWLWISAWWSEDPDHDFGEDRPDSVKNLGAPWNQYKICAVSAYTQNPAELDQIAKDHPSLAAAYRAVLDESGASWCSNPYIEKGVNNQKTNCIGCHQFAGTEISQMEIISDEQRFPALGRLKQRETFPTDYIWAATQGQQSWLDAMNSLRFRTESPKGL
ncbi:MAG: hypothetical protein EOP07_07945 [Proteobacteria bacterium]|nr:MAG: hypothetical protein EOP07_07945 [Pseudomonadota bacterium]